MQREPATALEARAARYPLGGAVTLAELEGDPHPALARLRRREPVSWVPALRAWLVTSYPLALQVLRDPESFTVDDPRFSTAQVVGPSMLSLDGQEHARHRDPFARPFRLDPIRKQFGELVTTEVDRLLDAIEPAGRGELRSALAGPLAVVTMVHALGLDHVEPATARGWYDAIVAAVTAITEGAEPGDAGGQAFGELRDALGPAFDRDDASSLVAAAVGMPGGLERSEVASNAAVLLFGGIETTEGMIANAILLLLQNPGQRALAVNDPQLLERAIEESLRLEPAAATLDRYATRDARVGDADIPRGDLVCVSLAGANRDPALFPEPDRFDVSRENAHRHLAFAQGPHVCLGMHLARLEARVAVERALVRLPGLRLDPDRPSEVRGLVFRKPDRLDVVWD
jgi:cytochrome P450